MRTSRSSRGGARCTRTGLPDDPTSPATSCGRSSRSTGWRRGSRSTPRGARRTPRHWTQRRWRPGSSEPCGPPPARRCSMPRSTPCGGWRPRDASLLYVLYYIAAAGNEKNAGTIIRLISTPGGAQESRLHRVDRRSSPSGVAAPLWDRGRAGIAGPGDHPARIPGRRHVRPAHRRRPARHRRHPAGADRADRVLARPPRRARPAHPADAAGIGAQGPRSLRPPVLAGRRAAPARPPATPAR